MASDMGSGATFLVGIILVRLLCFTLFVAVKICEFLENGGIF